MTRVRVVGDNPKNMKLAVLLLEKAGFQALQVFVSPLSTSLMRSSSTVRAVALFEAAKGALVLLAGFGALSLIDHDAQRLAEQLVGHLHLNPAKHYPRIFIDTAAHLTDARLWLVTTLGAAYGLVRFVEAYGLWRGRRWAEWFAAVSGGIYIPFELYELFKGVTWLSLVALVVNVFIVGLMINALLRAHRVETVNAV
jgi:uncharacterized membrane protein (DUF2068 family)